MLSALRWFPTGMVVPILVVLLQARDVPTSLVGPLLGAYSAVVIVLEVPTGGLADRVGRRRTQLAATAATALGTLVFAIATSPATFLLAMLPLGIGRALLSGPLEAWFVDESHRVDPEADLQDSFSRAETAAALGLGIGALTTALLPQLVSLPEAGTGLIAPSLPAILAAAAEGVGLLAAWRLMRPEGSALEDGPDDVPTSWSGTIRAAVATARGPVLRRVLLLEFALAMAIVAEEQVTPTELVRLLGERDAASLFATLAAIGFAGVAAGARLAPRLSARLGARPGYAAAALLAAVATMMGAGGTGPTLAAGYLLVYACLGLRTPLRSTLLHARTASHQRATVLSVASLTFQLGGLLASLTLLPLYAATVPAAGFLLPAVVVTIAVGVMLRPVDAE